MHVIERSPALETETVQDLYSFVVGLRDNYGDDLPEAAASIAAKEGHDKTSKDDYQKAFPLLFEKYVGRILERRDDFRHIFKTERGSMYFVFNDGKTLRLKYDPDYPHGMLQPITREIYFMDPKKAQEFREIDKRYGDDAMVGFTFEPKGLEVGTIPLEFNIYERIRIVVKCQNGIWKVEGTQHESGEIDSTEISGGYHFWHEITELIK